MTERQDQDLNWDDQLELFESLTVEEIEESREMFSESSYGICSVPYWALGRSLWPTDSWPT